MKILKNFCIKYLRNQGYFIEKEYKCAVGLLEINGTKKTCVVCSGVPYELRGSVWNVKEILESRTEGT